MGKLVDTDKGMKSILKELSEFKKSAVKVGVLEGSGSNDGVPIVEYATYNENGVAGKNGKWKIPPRPFIKGWVNNKKEKILRTIEKLYSSVASGNMSSEQALKKLGEFGQDGIKSYIRSGDFTPNAPSTIKQKGSSRPLIDTGTLRNSIRYEVVKE